MAVGAAIQAGVLKGEVKDVLLLDVTPLTLGLETLGGVATPLIPRNTTIPTKKSQIFSTARTTSRAWRSTFCRASGPWLARTRRLGRFILDGIPPAPRGVPQIEVTFDIDANGILNVTAKDMATSKEQKITITASSGLSKDEVERMVREAEAHAEEDKRRRDLIEARNMADSLAYQAEKTLRELGDQVPADIKSEVDSKITDVRDALQTEDLERIKSSSDALSNSMQKIGQAMYAQQQANAGTRGDMGNMGGTDGVGGDGAGPEAGGQQGSAEEGTVEGEFREV